MRRFFCAWMILCPTIAGADADVVDLVYVLQHDNVTTADLAAAASDWLVLEPSRSGANAGDLTPAEVSSIRSDGPCNKQVLAYLSIGEAEDYRDYWDPAWVDAQGVPVPGVAPAWLGPVDPDWPGNYKVRYWDPDWQAIILGGGSSPLDRIEAQGFDGVYLDIIDAYYFWSEEEHELTRMDARTKMIDFIEAIAVHGRQVDADFLVFPQNATDIIRDDDDGLDAETDRYFAAVSGIGIEDLYYDELTPMPPVETDYRLDQLAEFMSRGKTVLVTDYVLDQNNPTPAANDARVADFISRCRSAGFVPFAAHKDRDLDEVVEIGGAGWSVVQPVPGCDGCSAADIAEPFGVLDLADISAFVAAFTTQQPPADLAEPFGVFDLADLSAFVAAFTGGCV